MVSDDKPKVVLNDLLYVPTALVRSRHLDEFTYEFERTNYVSQTDLPKQCSNCKWWGQKWQGNKTCASYGYTETMSCKEFDFVQRKEKETVTITTYKQLNDDTYVFGRGNLQKIERVFADLEIIDQRAAPKLGINLVCKATLFEEQQRVVDDWLAHGYGILQAPTGWGKTVTWCWLVARLGLRTMLLSHETRHLQVGWEGLYKHTNIAELEEAAGEHLCGRFGWDWEIIGEEVDEDTGAKKPKYRWYRVPGKTYPITFSTYQSLYSEKGWTVLIKDLKDYYGLVWIEEAHHESAYSYHQVTRAFNPWYRGGQSATPTRKDQTHVGIYDTIGPVTALGKKEQMTPVVNFIDTGVFVPAWVFKGMYAAGRVWTWLSKNDTYRDVILQNVLTDVRNGRRVLLITERREFAFWLQAQVNISGYNSVLIIGGSVSKEQEAYSIAMIENKLHLIIGSKVIKENYDIPPMDCLHLPFHNFVEESEQQMVGRVRRDLKDKLLAMNGKQKPDPLIRVYKWHADDKLAKMAYGWRHRLYTSWGFEITEEPKTEKLIDLKPKVKKFSMKDWIDAETKGKPES